MLNRSFLGGSLQACACLPAAPQPDSPAPQPTATSQTTTSSRPNGREKAGICGGRRCTTAVSSTAEMPTKIKIGLGQLDVSTEIKHVHPESLTISVENHITLSGVPSMDNGLVNAFSSENLHLKSDLIKPVEEGFHSSQDTCLGTVHETTVDHLKYTHNKENENAVLEVRMQPCTQDCCDEVHGKYLRLPEQTHSEDATCAYLPQVQLHSYNIHFPPSLMTQHRNSVLSLGTSTPGGAVNTNVEMIPILFNSTNKNVLRPSLTPGASANNCAACDQIKGMINSSIMSQALPSCSGESCNGISALPQDTAPVCDELAEVREAVVSITTNNLEESVFQNSNGGGTSHNLTTSQSAMEESANSHRNYSSPQVIICQLKGGTHILCINNTDTRELRTVHLVPQYHDQHKYIQPDATNAVASVLGQFLPVAGKLNICAQELDNGSLYTCHSNPNHQETTKLTLVGYCDCFANGDFCSNCNCNNCYNNPQHEIERFKAIKMSFPWLQIRETMDVGSTGNEACLDRNPEAFLPKIGKGKLGDIKPRHNKGCNCKRSGCLKNYCECFEAKIMCSSICKCVGCKNYEESPDRKTLMNMSNHMEIKNDSVSCSNFEILSKTRKDSRQSSTCISWEVVEATCACLLAQAEEAEKEAYSICLAEQMILEEFGRCLSQILHSEFKSKGLNVE
ncbi:tesmin isoform X3 [Hemicordylus capensis]|uniref:tesmin isoform X3 n=1 Tax=Hemicordylus capensis TaxID=884348 RepID=UPI0023046501|nr:tesmin isoform X3 [Hemicordylus capensis]